MKLISLLDLVLLTEGIVESDQGESRTIKNTCFDRIIKYAEFLKQPLALGMFVPCYDDGQIHEKPGDLAYQLAEENDHTASKWAIEEYNEAKGKVLFKGFELKDSGWYENKDEIKNTTVGIDINLKSGSISIFQQNGISFGIVKNIEDLTQFDLELTSSAIKQIGL